MANKQVAHISIFKKELSFTFILQFEKFEVNIFSSLFWYILRKSFYLKWFHVFGVRIQLSM